MTFESKTLAWWVAAALVAVTLPAPARAQHISIDGRLLPGQTLVGPNYTIGANLGKQVGGNLFQSFGIFGLSSGESATFTGPATVSNIIGRVTGGSASSINGAVKSTIAGANLYLINPAGIVFGPNATINVSGSFHASTADYLKLSDGSRFQATNPDGSTLSAAAPAAFGFLNAVPPAITVNGSFLGVQQGQTLGVVGGPISISGGATLQAPSGAVRVTGVASTGEVPVDPLNQAAMTVTQLAPVSITQSSALDVSNGGNSLGGSGNVFVGAGALTIDSSKINALNFGPDPGGPISITADTVSLTNGGAISSLSFHAGNGGPVTLSSTGALSLVNGQINSNTFATGNAGAVSVTAASASLTAGGQIASKTFGAGPAGNISVAVGGALFIAGNSVILSDTFSTGNAGTVNVTAGTLSTISSGRIASTAQQSSGNAGSVSVNVSGSLTIDGTGSTQVLQSGIFALALSGTTGNAGQVSVNAGTLSVINPNSDISTTTFGAGTAGRVNVAAGNLSVASGGSIASLTFTAANAGEVNVTAGNLALPGGSIATTTLGAGAAGQVHVAAGSLSITGGGKIASSTSGSGNGGSVSIDVAGPTSIDGGAANIATGVFAQTLNPRDGAGNAGQIVINAGTASLSNGGVISTNTLGPGNAGSVLVQVAGQMSIGGALAGISSSATPQPVNGILGTGGNAGQVTIHAGAVMVTGGGQIATSTQGAGAGGDIDLAVGGNILLSGAGPQITAEATASGGAGSITLLAANLTLQSGAAISTQAATANGGNITLTVGDFLYLVSSRITTSVQGASGNGGNITIDPQLLVLNHSSIIAQAVAGHGGNITIVANDFIPSNDSIVSASSQLGISGSIELIGPRVDLNGSLVVLSSELRSAAEVLRTSCDARGRKQSSLVESGHGGLPQDTETTIPALYIVNRDFLPGSGTTSRNDPAVPPVREAVRLTMGCG